MSFELFVGRTLRTKPRREATEKGIINKQVTGANIVRQSRHFNKQVVFAILEYHTWWPTKYGDIISRLSDYPPIDFSQTTTTTHCFPSAIAGLHIHDELSINPAPAHPSILDFRRVLDAAYAPRFQSLLPPPEAIYAPKATEPKLVLISRNG